MLRHRGNRLLAFALGLSLALHAGFLLTAPNPASFAASTERRTVIPVRLTSPTITPATQPDEPREEPEPEPSKEPEPKEIDLGLDAPNPPSRTWLGFAEYLKHLAPRSEIEQAAFTDDPIAAAPYAPPTPDTPPIRPTPTPTPAPNSIAPAPDALAAQPDEQSDNQRPGERLHAAPSQANAETTNSDEHASPRDSESHDSLTQRQAPAAIDARSSEIAFNDVDETVEADALQPGTTAQTGDDVAHTSFMAPLRAILDQAREAAALTASSHQPQPASVMPAPPTPPQDAIARQPTRGARNTGAQSDRESDPSSTIDVPRDQWQLGKPLAAHGLEIKPRRPDMTILTTLTAWPRNPLCTIAFDRDGVPTRAAIVRSTGDSRVDSAIEACLYRWRAAGKQLDALAAGETVNLTIRLLINPSRRAEDKDDPA